MRCARILVACALVALALHASCGVGAAESSALSSQDNERNGMILAANEARAALEVNALAGLLAEANPTATPMGQLASV